MAVYSVLYDYRIEQFSGIGEAGERTVNAINQILNAARYGTETKVSSDLTITNDTPKLDTDKIEEIMNQIKPNQVEKIKINSKRFENLLPSSIITNKQIEDFLIMCVEEHNKRERNKALIR